MRRILKATTLGLTLCMGIHAQEKPTFTWLDFNTADMNKIYTSDKGEKVSVQTNETNLAPQAKFFYTQDVYNPLAAIGETMPTESLYRNLPTTSELRKNEATCLTVSSICLDLYSSSNRRKDE